MKAVKLTLAVVGIVGLLFGLAPGVWAGGAGGVLACCVVTNPGGGALAMKGTMAVVWTPPPVGPNVDVKLRLERGGKFGFFQLNLKANIYGLDNFEFSCVVLNPDEPGNSDETKDAVTTFVNEILDSFFPARKSLLRLVITRSSITFTDGNAGGPIGTTGRVAAIGDIIIYAVDPDNANLEPNLDCETQ